LQIDYNFIRAYPDTALTAFYKPNRTLDYEYFNDCKTGKEMSRLARFTCGDIKDKSLSTTVIFTQAFDPALVLGQNNWISIVNEKQKDAWDLLHDLKVTYFCDNSWDIKATLNPTEYSKSKNTAHNSNADEYDQWASRRVDPHTCELKEPHAYIDEKATAQKAKWGFGK
jgi:hypothetical protein